MRTGRRPTRSRSTLESVSFPHVTPFNIMFIGAFPKAARSSNGSRKYPIGLLTGQSWVKDFARVGVPAMKPGLKDIVVPV